MIYLRARYYDSAVGVFVSEDPIKDGLNWYAYCAGNPVMYVDPWGLEITLIGTEEEKTRTFHQLQILTNDELHMDVQTGVVTIVSEGNMNTDKDLVHGTKMLRDIISNDEFDCQIKREYVKNDGCYVDYTPNGAVVRMNDWSEEGENWYYEVSNGENGIIYEDHKDVSHIILGHELIHATHHMNETLASTSRTVYRYTNMGLVADVRGNLNVSEEYNTVGLPHVVEFPNPNSEIAFRRFYLPWPNSLTENALRAEQGYNKRIAY